MFRILREISNTVKMANEISSSVNGGAKWTVFITNRSFVAQVIATLFAVAGIFGIFIPVDSSTIVEVIIAIGFLSSQAWAMFERLKGKTYVVWNKKQAEKAVEQAEAIKSDALTTALNNAIYSGARK